MNWQKIVFWAYCKALFLCYFNVFSQSKLHFIVIADTHDPSIGQTNLKTFNSLTSSRGVAQAISKYAELQLNPFYLEGDKCNPKELDNLLASLKVGYDDVLFFYFIGHGWNNRQNNYPSFILGNASTDKATLETISRNQYDIFKALISKKARMTLVIGEACNKERSDAPPLTTKREIDIMAPAVYSPAKIKALFRNWTGSLLMSSCQRNQVSFSDPKGGWMSIAWQAAFEKYWSDDFKGSADWKAIFKEVQRLTETTAIKNQQKQNPQYEINITAYNSKSSSPTTPTTTLVTVSQNNTPCPSIESYVNETALAGIREDLPLLNEMYNDIDSDNAEEYAQAFGLFYKNQKNFYEKLGPMVFYDAIEIPQKCRANFEANTKWVFNSTNEINQRLAVINKYTTNPNKLVQQARSDLPSLIRRLQEILEKYDK